MKQIPQYRVDKLWADVYLAEYITSGDSAKAKKSANIAARAIKDNFENYGKPQQEKEMKHKIKPKVQVNKAEIKPKHPYENEECGVTTLVKFLVIALIVIGLGFVGVQGFKNCKAKKEARIQQELIQ